MSRYEKSVTSILISLIILTFSTVFIASATGANQTLETSSAMLDSSKPQIVDPVESDEEESSKPKVESEASKSPAGESSKSSSSASSKKASSFGGTSSKKSTTSSKRAVSSKKSQVTGTVSKKPEPTFSGKDTTPSGNVASKDVVSNQSRTPKIIERLDKTALKWIFVPILGIVLSLAILITENLRAIKAKKAAARRKSPYNRRTPPGNARKTNPRSRRPDVRFNDDDDE